LPSRQSAKLTSAQNRQAVHCGLRPSGMSTSDGAILVDFPALPPIRLADFSTGPRRNLSSRHKSDFESASQFLRKASTIAALPFAALRLLPHRRDDLAYQLHSRDQQAHSAVPECVATVVFWEIHLQPCCHLSF